MNSITIQMFKTQHNVGLELSFCNSLSSTLRTITFLEFNASSLLCDANVPLNGLTFLEMRLCILVEGCYT